jgi:isocitrate dehydrogenase
MTDTVRITVARGDGIGPEIMEATLRMLDAAGVTLGIDDVAIGERMYRAGHASGISPEAWAVIRRNRVLLKGPITTPQGGGHKSLNVTLRKALNLFANVRPSKSFAPFVASSHPGIDLVIIRENEEDLYAGIEHQQTADVTQVLKLVTRSGSERVIRYAFEYARACGRRRVTCMTKDNIMKVTDGLFHRVFDEVAAQYPDIAADHQIIDIGAARLAAQPETFDVIVTLNLYGDIISDVAAQVAGSVGLAGSANVGSTAAMFEAVHGSAPDIAGMGVANPSGLLLAAIQMLVHLGQAERAALLKNAWLCTLESGIHPADIYRSGISQRLAGTDAFAAAVIERLGERPRRLGSVRYRTGGITVPPSSAPPVEKALVGVDVFLDWNVDGRDPNRLGALVETAAPPSWRLTMLTNRGVKVYPDGIPETYCTDHWRARCLPREDGAAVGFEGVLELLAALHSHDLRVIKTEHLYTMDGRAAYSLGQGE